MKTPEYQERFYRQWVIQKDLVAFQAKRQETDLFISAEDDLKDKAQELIDKYRSQIESYIAMNPLFKASLAPLEIDEDSPPIVRHMLEASKKAGVGPMAAVAGAIAQFVGQGLLEFSNQVIVENGGDIFLKSGRSRKIGIYAGASDFTGKLCIEIEPQQTPLGICTSSGTVGHSFSFGKADAAIILAKSATLADAVATKVGNLVRESCDIDKGIKFAKALDGVIGVVIILKGNLGVWGDVKLVKS